MNANMTRWDPFRDFESFSNRLSQFFASPSIARRTDDGMIAEWSPALDVEELEGEYLLKADLPAVTRENIKVGLESGVLTIEGERKCEKSETAKRVHRLEREYGKFMRCLAVPSDVDQQKISADCKDGVLTVHLPKSATAMPRNVDVKVM
jgi:HSP20 family protein